MKKFGECRCANYLIFENTVKLLKIISEGYGKWGVGRRGQCYWDALYERIINKIK